VARFTQSSEEEEEEECEDVVVQLPTWTPPTLPRHQQRSRSFPRRWNAAGGSGGGLRRAVGRLGATGRLVGRRSVPSSSWGGRQALEQALLFAAAVPLRASTNAGPTTATRAMAVTDHPADTDSSQRLQTESALNSEMMAQNDVVFIP